MGNKITGAIGAIVAGGIFTLALAACVENSRNNYLGDASAIGTEGNAFGRMEYEWQMLHDPATGKIPAHIREKELAFAATLPKAERHWANSMGKSTAGTWQQRGPWNVGGRTRAFAMDVTDENILLAGSCAGGMWRSIDGGQSWVATNSQEQNKSVSCLAQDTRNGHTNVWYYGSGEAVGASPSASGAYYLGNGIYRSTDGGATWSVLPSTVSNSNTAFDKWSDLSWNIVTDASNATEDEVYVAALGGIYRSIDGGANWTLVKGTFGSVSDCYFTDIAITSTGVVYATLSSDGPNKGVYRSTDGVNFTNITPAFAQVYERVKIGISPSDENQVYFVGHTPGYGQPDTNFVGTVEWNSLWKYTYISGDGTGAGGNWEDRSANLPTTGGQFDKFQSQGSYDLVVKVKPNDPNTVFIGGTNLYRSTNGFSDPNSTSFIGGYLQGASLPVVAQYPNHHPDQHELIFYPSNANKMISANDGGMYRCDDNTATNITWTPLNNGYLTSMFYTCAIDHATTSNIIIGGAQDNGSWYTNSTNLTDPWVTPRGGDGSYCYIADNESAYYFSIQNGKMMRAKLSSQGAVDSFARIDPIGASSYQFINPYTIDPNNNNIMYLIAGRCLWRNDDLSGIPYASNWDSITTNWVQFPDSLTTTNLRYSAVAVSKTPANRVYLGTTARKVYRIDNANTGTPTKTEITSLLGTNAFPTGYVSCIAVDPNNADNVMVVFSNYGIYSLFYSSNGGTSWEKVAGNLEANNNGSGNGPSCRWASIIPVNGGTVYMVGTSVGVFATTQLNGLATYWTQQSSNEIGYSVVNMLDYRQTDGLLVAATHSHGIFSTVIDDVDDVLGVKQVNVGLKDMKLMNYPNPFDSRTTISFTLNKGSKGSLVVTDELGRVVRILANTYLPAGEHKYPFPAELLPAGIYYYTLRTEDATQSKAMTIVK